LGGSDVILGIIQSIVDVAAAMRVITQQKIQQYCSHHFQSAKGPENDAVRAIEDAASSFYFGRVA
jgi:hypothetical protein